MREDEGGKVSPAGSGGVWRETEEGAEEVVSVVAEGLGDRESVGVRGCGWSLFSLRDRRGEERSISGDTVGMDKGRDVGAGVSTTLGIPWWGPERFRTEEKCSQSW